jgi:hypothetical protein
MSSATEAPATRLPVKPSEDAVGYAKLNAVYGALLLTSLVATRERARAEPIRGVELVPLGAATFALSKVIAKEKVGTWVREPFVEEHSDGRPARGEGIQKAVGELLTCTRCVGAWSALGLVSLRLASPTAGRTVTSVLVASAANDFLQAGFNWLTARSNAGVQTSRKGA